MEHYPGRSHHAKNSVDAMRRYDAIRFVDLNFLMDWTTFFSKGIDNQVQLGVKGPHTNHCFIFEARDIVNEDLSCFRQVVTSCKRFMSPTGKDVPIILPDLTSTHWKEFKKLGKKQVIDYDPDNCASEINSVIQDIVPSSEKSHTSDTTLLGLRSFKISNDLHYIFNICEKQLNDNDIKVAPFEDKVKAHMTYDYCDHIRTDSDDRFSVDEKQQVLQFMLSNFPGKLVNIKTGFPINAAAEYVESKHGVDYKHILQRVKEKSKLVMRISKDSYVNTNHTLKTDEEALAMLPKVEFLLGVSNSRNNVEGDFNRIANSIIGSNLTKLAMPILQEILQRNQITLTDDEKKVKAARKVQAVLKAKATRERNKEQTISDRVTAALNGLSSAVTPSTTIASVQPVVQSVDATNSSIVPIVPSSTATISIPKGSRNRNRTVDSQTASNPGGDSSMVITTRPVINKDMFLNKVDPNIYTWVYITLTDTRSFEGLFAKVLPNPENNNIITLGIILNEDIIVNRRPRDPRFFNVQMKGYNKDYVFPMKYLLVTKCRYRIV